MGGLFSPGTETVQNPFQNSSTQTSQGSMGTAGQQTFTPNQQAKWMGDDVVNLAINGMPSTYNPYQNIAGFTPAQADAMRGVYGMGAGLGGLIPKGYGAIDEGASLVSQAGQGITGEDVGSFYNPMADNVTRQMQNIFGQQNAQTGADATKMAGGVGASRIGVAQGNIANQQSLAAGQTYSQLYNNALQAAQQQKQQQQSAGMGLAGIGGSAIGTGMQGLQSAYGIGALQQQQDQAVLNSNYQQQLGQQNLTYQNLAAKIAALQGLGSLGGTTTQIGGQTGNQSTNAFGTTSGTQGQSFQTPSTASQIAGGIGGLVGLGGLFFRRGGRLMNRGGRARFAAGGPSQFDYEGATNGSLYNKTGGFSLGNMTDPNAVLYPKTGGFTPGWGWLNSLGPSGQNLYNQMQTPKLPGGDIMNYTPQLHPGQPTPGGPTPPTPPAPSGPAPAPPAAAPDIGALTASAPAEAPAAAPATGGPPYRGWGPDFSNAPEGMTYRRGGKAGFASGGTPMTPLFPALSPQSREYDYQSVAGDINKNTRLRTLFKQAPFAGGKPPPGVRSKAEPPVPKQAQGQQDFTLNSYPGPIQAAAQQPGQDVSPDNVKKLQELGKDAIDNARVAGIQQQEERRPQDQEDQPQDQSDQGLAGAQETSEDQGYDEGGGVEDVGLPEQNVEAEPVDLSQFAGQDGRPAQNFDDRFGNWDQQGAPPPVTDVAGSVPLPTPRPEMPQASGTSAPMESRPTRPPGGRLGPPSLPVGGQGGGFMDRIGRNLRDPTRVALMKMGFGLMGSVGERDANGVTVKPLMSAIGKAANQGIEGYQGAMKQQNLASERQGRRALAENNLLEKMRANRERERRLGTVPEVPGAPAVQPPPFQTAPPSGIPQAPPREGPVPTAPEAQAPDPTTTVASMSSLSLEPGGDRRKMDPPLPPATGNYSSEAIATAGEQYAQTGKLPPGLARDKEFRAAVMNYGGEVLKSRGITHNQAVEMWRFAPRQAGWIMGVDGRQAGSMGTVIDHLDTLKELTGALKNGDNQTYNMIRNKYKKWTGENTPTDVETGAPIIGAEIMKAVGAAGAGTGAERETTGLNIGDLSKSPAQFEGAITTAQKLVAGQLRTKTRQAEAIGLPRDRLDALVGKRAREVLDSLPAEGGEAPNKGAAAPLEAPITQTFQGKNWQLKPGTDRRKRENWEVID